MKENEIEQTANRNDDSSRQNTLSQNKKRSRNKTRTRDFTKGPIVTSILSFAIPLLFTSVVQQLYSTVDLFFVSNVLGNQAAAALGISTLLITCLIGLFTGLSVGANIAVACLFGTRDIDDLRHGIHVSIAISLIAGAILAFAGVLLAPLYIEAMKTPSSAIADALTYLRMYFIAMLPISLYNMAAGVCRALGDSRTPLLAQTVGGIGNIHPLCSWFRNRRCCVEHVGIEQHRCDNCCGLSGKNRRTVCATLVQIVSRPYFPRNHPANRHSRRIAIAGYHSVKRGRTTPN